MVKEHFVQDVMQNNKLLHILGKGSPIVLLPQSSSEFSVCSDFRVGSQLGVDPNKDIMLGGINGVMNVKRFYSAKGKFISLCERNSKAHATGNSYSTEVEGSGQLDRLSDQRLFSCVTCGILSFACVAIVQPREPTARYLMSADCSFFNDWIVGSRTPDNGYNTVAGNGIVSQQNSSPSMLHVSIHFIIFYFGFQYPYYLHKSHYIDFVLIFYY